MLNIVKTVLIAGGFAYLGLLVTALLLTPRALYPVPSIGYAMDHRYAFITDAAGERIATTYLPHREGTTLMLFHHGNGEDLSHAQQRLEAFHAQGYAALAYDYPGYGHSSGKPGEQRIYTAAEAVWKYATTTLGFQPSQIIHYGYSLGSGPAFELGRTFPSRAIVIEGAFTGVFRIFTRIRLLPWEPFNNLGKIDSLLAPLLIFHGTDDATVPFSHGKTLAKAGSPGTRFVVAEGAGHIDVCEVLGDERWLQLRAFLNETKP